MGEPEIAAIKDALEHQCATGFYLCTRDWCCMYGMRGNPNSPWRDVAHRNAAEASLTRSKSDGGPA